MEAPERDQFLALAGDDQDALRVDRHLRIGCREGAGVAEMDGRIRAIEEPGLGEQEDARAGRAQESATIMHGAKPVDQFRMLSLLPALGSEQDRRDDDDVGRVDCGDARCTVTGTRLASSSGPVCRPTISDRNGGAWRGATSGTGTMEKAFMTSKMPLSVDTTASGMATRLTWSGSGPV